MKSPRVVALIVGAQVLVVAYLLFGLPDHSREDLKRPDVDEAEGQSLLDGGPNLQGASEAPPTAGPEPADEDAVTRVLLHGKITNAEGAAVSRLVCGAIGTTGAVFEAFYRDNTGHYARAGMLPGVYRFRALADGYAVYDQMIRIPDGVPKFEYAVRMEKLLELPVRFLTPEGHSLASAVPEAQEWLARSLSVSATTDDPPEHLRMTTDPAHHSFGRGEFVPSTREPDAKLKDGRDGTLRIRGTLPVQVGMYLRQERLEVQRLEEAVKSLDFRIDPERIRSLLAGVTFRLTCDGDRSALDDVVVLLHDSTSGEPEEDDFERTGDTLTVRNHPPGTLHLQIHGGEGLAPFFRNVKLAPGQVLDLGTVHLDRLHDQRFLIQDNKGTPVGGATVWPYELDLGWMAAAGMPVHFTSNAKGIVRPTLGGKRYGLRIREPNRGSYVAEVDLTKEQPGVIRITLPPFVPFALRTGRVELPVNIRILDNDGHVLVAQKFRAPSILPVALAAGTYEIITTRRDGDEESEELRVAEPMTEMIVIE